MEPEECKAKRRCVNPFKIVLLLLFVLAVCLFLRATVLRVEAQARVAYEVVLDGFWRFASARYKVALLEETDFDAQLFVPRGGGLKLEESWRAYVEHAFSEEQLRRNVAPLLNSVKIAAKGFSAVDVPIVTAGQAAFLAAFYLVNVDALRRGDARRRVEIEELRAKMEDASPREAARAATKLAKLQSDLDARAVRYSDVYASVDALATAEPAWMERVRSVAEVTFTARAGMQIATAAAKIGKCVQSMAQIAETVRTGEFFELPPLLSATPPRSEARGAGDSGDVACYCCGARLGRGLPGYPANKLVFESPSQRTQSGGSQSQPKVCAMCAAISFLSPIKPGSARLVIRVRERGATGQYLLDEQLRMLVLGEMGIIAGKYVLLQTGEKIGGRPVSEGLGGAQYALYRVAVSFDPVVFEEYEVEALVNGTNLVLLGRHLAWLHYLDRVFRFAQVFDRGGVTGDKSRFAAIGRAIRHVQQEEVICAIYELVAAQLATPPLGVVRESQLEQLREQHVRWLEMEHKTDRAQFYRDVAGMTGLLYAFCQYVRSATRQAGATERIEVRKVIERCEDPYQVVYTVAGNTGSDVGTLYRNPGLHYTYDRVKDLLREIGVDPAQRESADDRGTLHLRLFFDDVVKAYSHLYESRYATTKAQRDFAYELKLSLYARFPDFLVQQSKEG